MSFVRPALCIATGPIIWALHFAAVYGFALLAIAWEAAPILMVKPCD